jgi:hypothetical protein
MSAGKSEQRLVHVNPQHLAEIDAAFTSNGRVSLEDLHRIFNLPQEEAAVDNVPTTNPPATADDEVAYEAVAAALGVEVEPEMPEERSERERGEALDRRLMAAREREERALAEREAEADREAEELWPSLAAYWNLTP